jgi:hypothetical protein
MTQLLLPSTLWVRLSNFVGFSLAYCPLSHLSNIGNALLVLIPACTYLPLQFTDGTIVAEFTLARISFLLWIFFIWGTGTFQHKENGFMPEEFSVYAGLVSIVLQQ